MTLYGVLLEGDLGLFRCMSMTCSLCVCVDSWMFFCVFPFCAPWALTISRMPTGGMEWLIPVLTSSPCNLPVSPPLSLCVPQTYMFTHKHTYTDTHLYRHRYMYKHSIHMHARAHMHTLTHRTHTNTCTHTHTNTHTTKITMYIMSPTIHPCDRTWNWVSCQHISQACPEQMCSLS